MDATVIDFLHKLHVLKCLFLQVRFGCGFSTKLKHLVCATVVTVKIKICTGHMHVPLIEKNLHSITMCQKQFFAKVSHVVHLKGI